MAKAATRPRGRTATATVAPPAQHIAPPVHVAPVPPASKVNLASLAAINLATLSGNPNYLFVDPFDFMPMLELGLVVVNTEFSNPENPIQKGTQITDAGRTFLADHTGPGGVASFQTLPSAPAPAAPASGPGKAPGLTIADKFKLAALNEAPGELPSPKRGGGGKEAAATPLDGLELGKAFDFPVSAEMPNPSKELAPIVSGANRKYTRGTGTFETKIETVTLVDGAGNVLKNADGSPVTRDEPRQVEIKIHDRRFEMRSLYNNDGSLWGARIQRMK